MTAPEPSEEERAWRQRPDMTSGEASGDKGKAPEKDEATAPASEPAEKPALPRSSSPASLNCVKSRNIRPTRANRAAKKGNKAPKAAFGRALVGLYLRVAARRAVRPCADGSVWV